MNSSFLLYCLAVTILCALSQYSMRHDIVTCVTLALILIVSAGFRPFGLDFNEYRIIIDSIFTQQIDDIESLMTAAKDPFFSSVVLICKYFTDDPQDVFLVVAIVSVLPKFLLALTLPRYRTIFLGLYAILLAPGLEFAAIRSGMSVGFCGLLLVGGLSLNKKIGVSLLSVLSHVSALVPIGMYWVSRPRRLDVFLVLLFVVAAAMYVAITMFDAISTLDIVTGVSRSDDYLYDKGNVNNFFFPASTLVLLALAAIWMMSRQAIWDITKIPRALFLSALLCATAFGAALPVSTYVIRILEFAWFFYLYAMMVLFARERSGFLQSGFVFWIALLITANVFRETWDLMAPALFVDW